MVALYITGSPQRMKLTRLKEMIGERFPDLAGLPKAQCIHAMAERLRLLTAKERKAGTPPPPVESVLRAKRITATAVPFVVTDAFLESYEWRRVRMVALKRAGARCECCGATPADGVRMHVDHIKPRRVYPELALDPDNLQVLCEVCNHGKGNWDETDWRQKEEAPAAPEGARPFGRFGMIKVREIA